MRDIRQGYAEARAIEMELRDRNPGPVLASDSDALGGQPAAYYAPALAASARWAELGVHVGSSPPASPGTYAQWQAGTVDFWAWKEIP